MSRPWRGSTTRRSLSLLGLTAAAVALVASGCSSSPSSSGSSPSSPSGSSSGSAAGATQASTTQAGTITIGYGVSETGPLASSTLGAAQTATAWQDSVNAAGGINGHQVKVIVGDSQGSAAAMSALTQTFVKQDHVDAIMLTDPIAEGAVGSYLRSSKVAILDGSGYLNSEWNGTPNFFATSINSSGTDQSDAAAAIAAGYTRVAVAACTASSSCESDGPIIQAAATAAGGTYEGLVEVPTGTASLTAQCLDFIQRNANAIALVLPPSDGVRLMQTCIMQGYKGVFVTSSSGFAQTQFAAAKGATMLVALNGFPWFASDSGVADFRAAMAKYEPSTAISTPVLTSVWASLELFKQVASGISGPVTPASVLAGYDSLKNATLGGMLPQPITYTAGKPSPVVNCYWPVKYVVGAANPTVITPSGAAGNGAAGDLSSSCFKGSAS